MLYSFVLTTRFLVLNSMLSATYHKINEFQYTMNRKRITGRGRISEQSTDGLRQPPEHLYSTLLTPTVRIKSISYDVDTGEVVFLPWGSICSGQFQKNNNSFYQEAFY